MRHGNSIPREKEPLAGAYCNFGQYHMRQCMEKLRSRSVAMRSRRARDLVAYPGRIAEGYRSMKVPLGGAWR